MSNISKLFSIQPTGKVDQVTVNPIDLATAIPDGYTNVISVQLGDTPYLCAYNSTTGATDLYLATAADPWLTPVESRIDLSSGPWEKLTTFTLGNEPYLLTYRAKDGMFGKL